MLARAAGGRVAADIWQLIGSGKLLAGRIELDSPNIAVVRLGPTRFARGTRKSNWAATIRPAGRCTSAICRPANW